MADREKLIELIRNTYVSIPPLTYRAVVDDTAAAVIADRLLANGVVVREKGEWKPVGNWSDCVCLKCDWMYAGFWASGWNFCPNCGADMRKEKPEA